MKKRIILSCAAVMMIISVAVMAAPDFTGTWSTSWGAVVLKQDEDKVTGTYGGPTPGRISGVVKENVLYFNWAGNGGGKGRGTFRLSQDGNSFKGTWGMGTSNSGGGTWNGTRTK
jgi:hypothetical protein